MNKNTTIPHYREYFDQVKTLLPGWGEKALRTKRQEALEYFVTQGFPKPSDEAWKYTRLGVFLTSPLATAIKTTLTQEALEPFRIRGLGCYTMVFVNGWCDAALSDSAIPGVRTMAVLPGMLADTSIQDAMDAWNAAFMTDGVNIRIPKDTLLDKPLHIIWVTTGGAVYPRNNIIMEERSKAVIVESFVDIGGIPAQAGHSPLAGEWPTASMSLTNAITTVTLKPNAMLEHYTHQQESMRANHIATTRVRLEQASTYTNFSFTSGGILSRNTIAVELQGEGATAKLYGLYLGRERQHCDHYLPVYHHAPHGVSRQKYKGVLDGSAKGIFYGKVVVPPGAQHSNAHQSDHNLLLSEHAAAFSRPELEIHADEVQCSHGAATGALDKEAMFYLCSRGIEATEARSLLVEGFLKEMLEEVPCHPLKQHWQGAIDLWLRTERN